MLPIATMLIALLAGTLSPTDAQAAPEDQIRALEHSWVDAMLRHDRSVFERVLDQGLTQIGPYGETGGKQEFLQFFSAGDWEYVEARLDDLRVTVLNDVALATGRLRRRIRMGTEHLEGVVAFSRVWVRRPPGWRVLHIQSTLVNAPRQANAGSARSSAAGGVQVIYRLRVEDANRKRFESAWAAVTQAALDRAAGARGSTLFRDPDDAGVFVAIARWQSRAQWQQYRSGAPLNPEAAREIAQTSVVISVNVLDEVADISR